MIYFFFWEQIDDHLTNKRKEKTHHETRLYTKKRNNCVNKLKSHKLKEKNKNAIEKFCNSGRRDNMIIRDYTLEIELYK